MSGSKILIVEDDGIIGHHIQNVLTKLEYHVVGIAASGIEALELCEKTLPDLVLMDITLQGPMDGVDVADQIHRKFDTPIIYLTAYTDEKTLRRAKISDPFGYILKPFDERTLHATIIIALHKHDLEITLRESEARYRTLVHNQGEGLVIVDPEETFRFANPAADEIFGLPEGKLEGHSLAEFTTSQQLAQIIEETNLRSRGERNSYEIEIKRTDGEIRNLVVVATPWFEKEGTFVGTCAILRDVTEQKRIMQREYEQRALAEALIEIGAALTSTLQLDEVLERILSSIDQVVPYDSAAIILVNGDTGRVAGVRGHLGDITQEEALHEQFDANKLPTLKRLIETGQPVLSNTTNQTDEWSYFPNSKWIQSFLGTPIIYNQKVVGALVLTCATPDFFSPEHLERLNIFANQAAIALNNAQLYNDAQERARYLALLNELTEIAIQSANFNEMLASLSERIGKIFKADGAYITFWDEEQQGTIQGAAFGLDSENYPRTTGKPQEHTLTASVLKYMKPLAVENVLDTPYIDPEVASEFPVKSMLGLPLLADGEKLGAMLIGYRQRHPFMQDEIERGMQIARQVALAIFKGRLLDQERERSRELIRANELISTLAHVAARIETIPSPEYVMETLVQELKNLGTLCVLSLRDEETGAYQIRYSTIPLESINSNPELQTYSLGAIQSAFDKSPFFQSMTNNHKAQYFPNSQEFITDLIGLKYPDTVLPRILTTVGIGEDLPMIFLPLMVSENETGRMWLWGEKLEQNDLPALSIFASQVAIALENARLYAEVQTLAMTDELTGLYNRRQLFQIALEEIKKAQENSVPLSLVIVDLDEFKLVNDTYGHVVGDEVVIEVANRCRQHARKTDSLGRYGGDEFIILLTDTELSAAAMVAERLRMMIQDVPVKTSGGDVYITASLGVAAVSQDSTDLVSLLIRADKSLYAAKQSGRNQVIAL